MNFPEGTARHAAREKRETVRGVNERISRAAEAVHGQARADFVCECVHERCFATLSMTADEWHAATAEPGYFVIRPGHVGEDEEAVVETGRYALVRPVRTAEPLGLSEALTGRG